MSTDQKCMTSDRGTEARRKRIATVTEGYMTAPR